MGSGSRACPECTCDGVEAHLPAVGEEGITDRRGARGRERQRFPAYCEDVVRAKTRAEWAAGLRQGGLEPQYRPLRALRETSKIARARNRCVWYAVAVLLPAITVASVPLVARKGSGVATIELRALSVAEHHLNGRVPASCRLGVEMRVGTELPHSAVVGVTQTAPWPRLHALCRADPRR